MQVLAIVKETISYDAKGQVIRYKFITLNIIYLKIYLISYQNQRKVIAHESEVTKCWRYTWLGTETESTNLTSGCMDLETEDEPKRWRIHWERHIIIQILKAMFSTLGLDIQWWKWKQWTWLRRVGVHMPGEGLCSILYTRSKSDLCQVLRVDRQTT